MQVPGVLVYCFNLPCLLSAADWCCLQSNVTHLEHGISACFQQHAHNGLVPLMASKHQACAVVCRGITPGQEALGVRAKHMLLLRYS